MAAILSDASDEAHQAMTEMPEDFQRNLSTYAAEGAIVFSGLDFFVVWMMLMLKRYDWLAERVVPLDEPKPRDQIAALLRERTRWVAAD